jgi:hypothetical protein
VEEVGWAAQLAQHQGASEPGISSAASVGFSHIESYVTLEAELHASFLCSLLCTSVGSLLLQSMVLPSPTHLSIQRSELITRKMRQK